MVALAKAVGVVAAADVVVQNFERQRHDHRAAVTVDDGLGQAGGAAGIHNPQRVVKRQPQGHKGGHRCVVPRGGVRHRRGVGHGPRAVQVTQAVVHDEVPHAGQCGAQLLHYGAAVQVAPGVAHAVHRNQDLGFDLSKAVEHRCRAHVGGANTPHPAQRYRGQKRHHGFGNVGQIGGHAVARLQALGL